MRNAKAVTTVAGIVVVLAIFYIIGIVGGVSDGAPLTNLWKCVPAFVVACAGTLILKADN